MLRGHYKRWRIADAPAEAEDDALAHGLGVAPLVARMLASRGIRDPEAGRAFLRPSLGDLPDPAGLPGCERAADRIVRAVRDREPIVIYGDYDVDGITATAILYHILRAADPHADVRRYVPHRIEEGYGLNEGAIEKLVEAGARVIVSVDCGITAVEPAATARRLGADLVITDHHTLGDPLPDAYALVHPRLRVRGSGAEVQSSRPETGNSPDLCGAGVAYKLAWQVARVWCGSERVSRVFRERLVDLLPLAALGTVADVVPLVGENRTITMHGLGRIKHTPFTGLNALIDAANLRSERIDSYHVGFVLGPRLNACGRMGHAKAAIRLLTDDDPEQARRIAGHLNTENHRRRAAQRAIFERAAGMVRDRGYDREDCRAIVLAEEGWHPGVVGIVCSKLVEAFGRPAVLLSTENGSARGSARSIDGFDIHEAFTACSEHLAAFGGHAMAAGLRLESAKVDAFRAAMIAHAAERITPEQLTPLLKIEAEADLPALTRTAVDQIRRLAPFGRGNPAPVLRIRGARLIQPADTMGREARHLAMLVEGGGATLRCIAWNMGELAPRLPAGAPLDLAAEPKLNHYQGRTTVELVVRDLRFES